MMGFNRLKCVLAVWAAAAVSLGGGGCQMAGPNAPGSQYSNSGLSDSMRMAGPSATGVVQAGFPPGTQPGQMPMGDPAANPGLPHEGIMTMHPPYIIEPPDTLLLEAIRLIPRPPYKIDPFDILVIQLAEPLPNQPVQGPYPVSPDGFVNLGFSYGTVRVAGLTLEQAALAIKKKLTERLADPQVAIALAQMRAIQQIRGEHLVGQDGTVTLGTYGSINVTGMNVWQAKLHIERYLSRWFLNPEVSITVNGFNSKVYYVIFDGGGYGQQIVALPITGKETVLDAIARVGGLPPFSSRRKITVARPRPDCCMQVLPVDWEVITQGGDPTTNWQLFPGDRVFVAADPLIHADNFIGKVLAPIERIFGATLLGTTTYDAIRFQGNGNGNGGGF